MERQVSYSLPSPTETPYRTPSSSLSRRSHYEDMSPSSTPPPLPSDVKVVKRRSHDSQLAQDDNLSPLDPRRFTPTLHASLVSEILTLRRDLEAKIKSIEQLEHSLDASQTQNDSLSKTLLTSNKEIRSVKRQMQLLEGGTLSALNDLSKERDDAVHEREDLRRRLDQSQKRAKSHEENADRTQALWEKEKEAWANERRALETKSHVMENRLKTVLDEMVRVQNQSQERHIGTRHEALPQERDEHGSVPSSPTITSSPDLRYRRQSMASIGSDYVGDRGSVLSFVNGYASNLADELALDDIDEDAADHGSDEEGGASADALAEETTRLPSSPSHKAKKVLGLTTDPKYPRDQEQNQQLSKDAHDEVETILHAPKPVYVDSAIQYSPPPSPVVKTSNQVDPIDQSLTLSNSSNNLITGNESKPSAMVSSSCQTLEYLPSPPLTPKHEDKQKLTVDKLNSERYESRSMSTQTDVRPRPGASRYIHSRTSTHDLGIPTIAIIPPTSRPSSPDTHVMLPPQTKNASCQVDSKALLRYTNSSMQTEEIRVDKRMILPSQVLSGPATSSQSGATTSKSKTNLYPRRGSSQTNQPISNSSSKRSAPQSVPLAPINDDGPLAVDSSTATSRPVRSSSLFAGFDDYADEEQDENHDDIFYEDEYSSRPTAKFTLRSGKLVSQDSALEDIGEVAAMSAGEAIALDNLRRSEVTLPPELRQFDSPEHAKNTARPNPVRRALSSTKQANVRRVAMISSGVAAHQSKLSQSTVGSESFDGGVPPPIPIPLRYSSARIGKSYSEGGRNSRGSSHNASPTRQYRSKYRPVLRKARSGPAISPNAQSRRPRSKSPPLDSRVSIVPEMPQFQMPGQTSFDPQPPLTNDFNTTYEASAPRPAIATGPRRSHGHLKQASDPGLLQQTSVVDAIAQTMVGEWMFKYVRRRKSFGKLDKDWDPNKSVEELTNNPNSAGVRHKRWVWLAPYERAVMWSSKQPMNGTALLGKSGRKLVVKSVLDVKDENPMPKNSLTGPAFNRSILILTPQRALKFTATSQERHFVWLTALSFLSHSPLSIGDLAALPPPPDEFRSPSPPPVPVGGSFRRRHLRDSIRIAKAPSRQEPGQRTGTEHTMHTDTYGSTRPPTQDYYDLDNDAALPPTIKRFHTRNRSNTAPRPLQNSFMSFSQRDVPSVFHHQANDPDRIQFPSTIGNPSIPNSRRGSDASMYGRPALTNTNVNHIPPGLSFTDSSHNASMTMRMDAFIDHRQTGKGNFKNLRLGGPSRATNKDLSYWGIEETTSPISPVESLTAPTISVRLSDSTDAGTVERDFFRGF